MEYPSTRSRGACSTGNPGNWTLSRRDHARSSAALDVSTGVMLSGYGRASAASSRARRSSGESQDGRSPVSSASRGRWRVGRQLTLAEAARQEVVPFAHPFAIHLRPQEQNRKGERFLLAIREAHVKVRPIPPRVAVDVGVDGVDLHQAVLYHALIQRPDLVAANINPASALDRDDIRRVELRDDRLRVVRRKGPFFQIVFDANRLFEGRQLWTVDRGRLLCSGQGRGRPGIGGHGPTAYYEQRHGRGGAYPHSCNHTISSACRAARSPSSAAVSHIWAPVSSECPNEMRLKRLRSTSLGAGLPSLPRKNPGGSTT